MTEKVLTKRLMDTLPRAEPGDRIVIRDRTQRGLRVRVTDRGVKTFSVIYRFEGVQRRASLGKWPETTVAVARARAQKVLAEVAAGHDPRRSTAETVADVAKPFDEETLFRAAAALEEAAVFTAKPPSVAGGAP